jgi:predicted HTH domain antitoxin
MSAIHHPKSSQDIVDPARLTPAELKVEMAVHLHAQGRLSVGKARELAGLTLWEFRQGRL